MSVATPLWNGEAEAPVVLTVAPQQVLPIDGLGAQDFLGRMPSIGIQYLAGTLEANEIAAVTLDKQYSRQPPLLLASEIMSHEPGLVGFTLYDDTVESTRAVVQMLRLAYSGPIVVGGYTATFHPDDVLREMPEVDFVVLREGERALLALVRHLRGQCSLSEVPNLAYRDGGEVRYTTACTLTDVREIPWPRRQWPESGDVTPIVTRRGCASRCSFCSMVPFYDTQLGPVVRLREPEDVVDEIAACMEQGARDFIVYDDDFGLARQSDQNWARRFIEIVAARKLEFHWGVELRVTDVLVGASVLRDLCDVGLNHISIGMESMLPRQLELYKKGYRQSHIFQALEVAEKLPLDYQTNVIFWDPWSTMAEAKEHVELLGEIGIQRQLGSGNFAFYAGTLLARKGTAIHQRLASAGLLRPVPGEFWHFDYEFQDPGVRRFYNGPFLDFVRNTHRKPRPAALWLFVPRLEHNGRRAEAARLRRFAAAIADVEYRYFRTLVELCQGGDAAERELRALHARFAVELDACHELIAEGAIVSPVAADYSSPLRRIGDTTS